MAWQIGDLRLDAERRELRRGDDDVPLEPQAFDVLVFLVLHRDRVVPKEELMDEVWGGRFVTEAAVTSRIKQVRRALGDDGQSQTHVRTHHGRGYRFVAPTEEVDGREDVVRPTPVADGAPPDRPGPAAGPARDRPPHPVPDHAHDPALVPVLATPLGRRCQVSGQGPPDLLLLPERASLDGDWEAADRARLLDGLGRLARVVRLEADPGGDATGEEAVLEVLDTAASASAVVLAQGAAARLALTLAGRAPERVDALVLLGPDLDDPPAHGPGIRTLVLHRTGDPVVPITRGRRLASVLDDAEFVALPGVGHGVDDDPEQVVDAVTDLLEEVAVRAASERTLTALVGLHGEEVSAAAQVLVGLGGRLRRGPEGAVVVSFDGPADALRALRSRRARGLVDEVGVGLAIDEVAREPELVAGHGVDVARLLARHAARGEVLLPNVVRQLLAGSGLVVEALEPLSLPHVGPHPVNRWVRDPAR